MAFAPFVPGISRSKISMETIGLSMFGHIAGISGASLILTGFTFGTFQVRQDRAHRPDAIAMNLARTFSATIWHGAPDSRQLVHGN